MTLKDYFKKYRITQDNFSAKTGISQGAISMYLTGKRRPSLKTALIITSATDNKVQCSELLQ